MRYKMNRKAIIDIGTNSIKFYVAESTPDGGIDTVLDENNIAQIGEGLRETGLLNQEAMKRNTQAIKEFVQKSKELEVDEVRAVGTMALRNAKNTDEFIKMVKDSAGIEIEVLSGDTEGDLSYLAAMSGLDTKDGKLVIFDTGGGSTEFTFGSGRKIEDSFSIDLGSLTITEKFFKEDPVSKEDVKEAVEEIRRVFKENKISRKADQLIGMGGTVTSIGAVKHKMEKYDPEIIQGSELQLKEIEEQIQLYSSKTNEERKKIVGLQPKRAQVILAGACILKVIMEETSVDRLTISDRGLRHGLAYKMLSK